MVTYPGIPPAAIGAALTYEESRERYDGEEFLLSRFELAGNTGTYIDSPAHRYRGRDDLAALPLERVADLPGRVIDATGASQRGLELEVPGDVAGQAVLVRTRWAERWGTDAYWEPGPYLAEETLDALVAARPAVVGVDFWNVDDTTGKSRPAHSNLLDAGILIVEHMCGLDRLPESGFRFFAVPLALVGGASCPVRAFAILNE